MSPHVVEWSCADVCSCRARLPCLCIIVCISNSASKTKRICVQALTFQKAQTERLTILNNLSGSLEPVCHHSLCEQAGCNAFTKRLLETLHAKFAA